MNIFNTFLLKASISAGLLVFSSISSAHNLWLNSTDFNPTFREKTGAHSKIYFGFGHKYPVHDFLDKKKLREFNLIKPDGKIQKLESGENGFLATSLILKNKGAHIVTAATDTGFYTMYNDKGRVHHKLGSKEGLESVILSLYYENYTKALINVGETSEHAYSTPVGHNIEIIPLENPYMKNIGDNLKIKVLYKGQPAAFTDINATYVGFSSSEDYAFSNKTGSDGVSTIKLLAPGEWIVRAVIKKPASEEIKDKCIQEKYSATMSFEVE